MEWYMLAAMLFGALLVLIFLGVPIAFSLAVISTISLFVIRGFPGLEILQTILLHYGTAYLFIILPLFLLMAEILFFTGVGDEAFTMAYRWVGRLPGGLSIAGTCACAIFSSICGSSTATAATMGLVALPEMIKRGYSKSMAAGSLAAGGTLGILIPPSAIMIIYGILTETSIGQMFIGGIIPGIVMVILFSIYMLIRCIVDPKAGPPAPPISWRDKFASVKPIWAVLLLIVIIIGGIYSGAATPTEVAGLGVVGAIVIGLVRRRLNMTNLKEAFLRAASTSCFVFFLVFGAMAFGWVLTYLEIPFRLSEFIIAAGLSPIMVIIIINFMLIGLGCFLDPASIIVVIIPCIFPVVMALGFDPVWFGIMFTMNMEMGNITPPVGLNLYVLKGVSPPEITTTDIIKGAAPFVALLGCGIALVIIFPSLAMWLPTTMLR